MSQIPTSDESNGGAAPQRERTDEGTQQTEGLDLEELLYSSSSFHAIAKPVSLTMILTALSVVYVNTEQSIQQGEQALAVYEAFGSNDADASTARNLGLSLANALIIVCVICAMTFVIVLLYKYRCMKCLIGYMVLSSSLLLGVMGGLMFDVAIERYMLNVDIVSFYLALFNFAAVGTISIFFQQGIPPFITQSYLVATSVILAWQLSHFDPWTSWTLLVMLALYDLCAVLTPCGPLRALVNLMSQEGSPDMPGLLYTARLPSEVQRPGTRQRRQQQQEEEQSHGNGQQQMGGIVPQSEPPSPASTESPVPGEGTNQEAPQEETQDPITGLLPLAIAKLYRLPLVHPVPPARRPSTTPLLEENGTVGNGSPNEVLAQQYTPEQLLQEVEAVFPHNGGRIDRTNHNGREKFLVKNRHGAVVRVLFMERDGKVYEEFQNDGDDQDKDNTIKLGLGDFIFYSVLVSNAVQYSFATFVACMLVILAGLGSTLVLLAVYRHALPALPISIFLGVIFYLLTRLLIEPWIEQILQDPFYV